MTERTRITPHIDTQGKKVEETHEDLVISSIQTERDTGSSVSGTLHTAYKETEFDILWSVMMTAKGIDMKLLAADTMFKTQSSQAVEDNGQKYMQKIIEHIVRERGGESAEKAMVSDVIVERDADTYQAGTLHTVKGIYEGDIRWIIEYDVDGTMDINMDGVHADSEFTREVIGRDNMQIAEQLIQKLSEKADAQRVSDIRNTLEAMLAQKKVIKAAKRARKAGSE